MTIKNFYSILPIAAALIGAGYSNASPISPQQAMKRVAEFEAQSLNASSEASNLQLISTYKAADTDALYILKSAEGKCIITGANDISAPVIACLDAADFNPEDISPATKWWLDLYAQEIAAASGAGLSETTPAPKAENRAPIQPMLKTWWDQTAPFNSMCPDYNNARTVTGEVATAMAQAMKYYEYPNVGKGSITYKWQSQDLTMDFSKYKPQWEQMKDIYNSASTQTEIDAVSEFIKACAYSLKSLFGAATFAQPYSWVVALADYWNYAPSTTMGLRLYYTYDQWVAKVYESLSKGCPVLYSGDGPSYSHAFVCDGYKEGDLFHINWGWAGKADGYYRLSALNPAYTGTNGGTGFYNGNQMAVFGMQPDFEGSEWEPVACVVDGASMNYAMKDYGNLILNGSIRGAITNYSNRDLVDVKFGFEIEDEKGNITIAGDLFKPTTVWVGYGINTFSVALSSKLPDGKYKVRPLFALPDANGKYVWRKAQMPVTMAPYWVLEMKGWEGKFLPATSKADLKATDIKLPSPARPGVNFRIDANLTNAGDCEALSNVYALIYDSKGTKVATGQKTAVDVLPGESINFETIASLPSTAAEGKYTVVLAVQSPINTAVYTDISAPFEFELQPKASEIKLVADKFYVTNANAVNPAAITINLEVTCTEGYYAQNILFWTNCTGKWANITRSPIIYLEKGETKQVSFTMADMDALNGKTYQILANYYNAENKYASLGQCSFTADTEASLEETGISDFAISLEPDGSALAISAPGMIQAAEIFSLNGILVNAASDLNASSARLDVSNLPVGLYVVRIATSDQSKTFRMIKK